MQNHSNENEFDLHENELVGGTHFHINGLALRLVLKQRQKGTRKYQALVVVGKSKGVSERSVPVRMRGSHFSCQASHQFPSLTHLLRVTDFADAATHMRACS